MRLPWSKEFDPQNGNEAIVIYIEDSLRQLLDVAQGTPSIVKKFPADKNRARRAVDFGVNRDFVVYFYPYDKKRELATEHLSLTRSLAKRKLDMPEIVLEDRTLETRKSHCFEIVVERRRDTIDPKQRWTHEHLKALAKALRRVHSITSEECGRPWRPVNDDDDPLEALERRWDSACEAAETIIGRRTIPARQAAYRERSLGRLERVKHCDLVVGRPVSETFARFENDALGIADLGRFEFCYREWDLVGVEHHILGGPGRLAEAFKAMYFEKLPPAAYKRYEVMSPFFRALYHLENIAALLPKLPTKPKPKKRGKTEDFSQEEKDLIGDLKEQATPDWESFLIAAQLEEI